MRHMVGLAMCLPLVACGEPKSSISSDKADAEPVQATEGISANLPTTTVEAPVADYLDNGMYWFPRSTLDALKYAIPSATCTPRGSGTTCFVEQAVPDAWCMGLSPCEGGMFEFVDNRLVASSVRVSETRLTSLIDETTAAYGRARSRVVDEPRLPIQSVHFAWKLGTNYLEMGQLGGIDSDGRQYRSQLVTIGSNPPVGIDFSATRPTTQGSVSISAVRGRVVLNPFEKDTSETSAPLPESTTHVTDSVAIDVSETPQ